MRIIFKEPGKPARQMVIDGRLETVQDLVGGRIEHLGVSPGIGLLCDEEGKLKGKAPNFFLPLYRDEIVGNVVFVGEKECEFTDIPEGALQTLQALFDN